jgi:hypothetical protein
VNVNPERPNKKNFLVEPLAWMMNCTPGGDLNGGSSLFEWETRQANQIKRGICANRAFNNFEVALNKVKFRMWKLKTLNWFYEPYSKLRL